MNDKAKAGESVGAQLVKVLVSAKRNDAARPAERAIVCEDCLYGPTFPCSECAK